MVRSLIAVSASVAMLVAQVPLVPAFGQSTLSAPQTTAQKSAIIEATFKAFPSGGEPLSMRIADLIAANPKLATELVTYMQTAQSLNRAQKVAAEHGLAAAADRLGIHAAFDDISQEQWIFALLMALAAVGIGVGLAVSHNNNSVAAASPN